MFLCTCLHVYCAPELLNSLAAASLPATKYEPKHCKALKVIQFGVICFFVCMHKDTVMFNNKVKNVFLFLMKSEVFCNHMLVEL